MKITSFLFQIFHIEMFTNICFYGLFGPSQINVMISVTVRGFDQIYIYRMKDKSSPAAVK